MMNKTDKIYIAGHNGLVGSAITRHLKKEGYDNLILADRSQLDLTKQDQVYSFFEKERPDFVFLAAAKVGGIMANNTYRADFIYDNLQIQNNVIHASWKYSVKKLLFLGSSCIYPKESPQPMLEEFMLTSPLEYTNEPYAIAKIAGIKLCESYNIQYGTDFIPVMPTNLYGPNDNYDLYESHVLPALIRKMHLGKNLMEGNMGALRKDFILRPVRGFNIGLSDKELIFFLQNFGIFLTNGKVDIKLWGSGKPLREFLHSDDLAEAVIFVMNKISFQDIVKERGLKEIRNTHINIGSGEDLSISDLAIMIKNVIGFEGELSWDPSKPDGTFRKLMDVTRLKNLGWQYNISLERGVADVYKIYCDSLK